jgi:hypothetical protein
VDSWYGSKPFLRAQVHSVRTIGPLAHHHSEEAIPGSRRRKRPQAANRPWRPRGECPFVEIPDAEESVGHGACEQTALGEKSKSPLNWTSWRRSTSS